VSTSIPTVYNARAQVAAAHRRKNATVSELHDAQRGMAEANIAQAIERNLAKAPDLRPDQITRLTALLNGDAA